MLELPIFDSFNQGKVIGTISIDENSLPSHPHWHMAIGYYMSNNAYKLDSVAIVPESAYRSYKLVS